MNPDDIRMRIGLKYVARVILASCVFLLCAASPSDGDGAEAAIRAGDVVRTIYDGKPTIYLYQGNGRFGSSYGPLGLHLRPGHGGSERGKTQYMHLLHMGRGKFAADYLMPMAEVYWYKDFESVSEYSQRQSFYDGVLKTSFTGDGNRIEVSTWFDPVQKDLGCISIHSSQDRLQVVVDPLEALRLHYDQFVDQQVIAERMGEVWKISLECLGKKSTLYMETNAAVGKFVSKQKDTKFFLTLNNGETYIKISYGKPINTSVKKSLKQTKEWWHSKWGNSGYIKVTDDKAQKMWVRSMAMFMSSYADTKEGLSPPMGYSSNGWPFYFPQDVSYIHPVLLATGNLGIAKSWIEHWAERIDGMRAYTKRFYSVDGVLAPWVFPYGDFEGYHDPTPPNRFYYEVHNSGYLARMAHEASVHVNDVEWTRKYAAPLLAGCAEFYANICTKGEDGLWHLYVEPSMGQDERGGMNQKDYLCALYSAQYCFQKAIEHGLDADGRYDRILADGLAFEALKSERGFYFSCAGRGEDDFGKQKHPVQLNELAFLPVGDAPSIAASVAYDLRYDITQDAGKPYFYGWTLGEFLLAGSRIGNAPQWKRDWDNMEPSDYVDPEWVQIYETSGDYDMPFYNITNGLVAQSLANNLVSDWYGVLEIAKCNPWQGRVYVRGMRSLLGVTVEGEIEGDAYKVKLTAWKDTGFELNGELITMKKGQCVERSSGDMN